MLESNRSAAWGFARRVVPQGVALFLVNRLSHDGNHEAPQSLSLEN